MRSTKNLTSASALLRISVLKRSVDYKSFSTTSESRQPQKIPSRLKSNSSKASTIPDTIPKDSTKIIYLTSVDKILNKDSVNWDRVSMAFQTYYQKRDAKSSFRLANRIAEMKLVPPANVLGLILRFSTEQDVRFSGSVALAIFENVVKNKSRLNDLGLQSLIRSLRNCVDPFVRESFYELFQSYFAYSHPKLQVIQSVDISLLHSLVESGELEGAKQVFERFVANRFNGKGATDFYEELEEFPWNTLFKTFVSKWGEVEFGMKIVKCMDQMGQNVPSRFWHLLLECAISFRHPEGVEFVWKNAIQNGKISPSDSSLTSIMNLFIELRGSSIPSEALQKLSQINSTRSVSDNGLSLLIDLLLTSPSYLHNKSLSLGSFFKSIQILHECTPTVDIRDLEVGCEVLWNLIHFQGIQFEKVMNAMSKVGEASISQSETPQQFLTFSMNLVLRACNQSNAASTCLHFYRNFIEQGVIPNRDTFEAICFAALCLGNSKKLGYLIYQECLAFGVKPSQRMVELLIRGSMKGTDFSSSLFYVSRLQNPPEELPQYLMQHLTRSFANFKDNRLQELITNPVAVKGKYLDFPSDSLLEKSAAPTSQGITRYSFFYDKGNCYRFVNGWPADQLSVSIA